MGAGRSHCIGNAGVVPEEIQWELLIDLRSQMEDFKMFY